MAILIDAYNEFTIKDLTNLREKKIDFFKHVINASMVELIQDQGNDYLLHLFPDDIELYINPSLYETRIIEAPDGIIRTITILNNDASGWDLEADEKTEDLCKECGGKLMTKYGFLRRMDELGLGDGYQNSPMTEQAGDNKSGKVSKELKSVRAKKKSSLN